MWVCRTAEKMFRCSGMFTWLQPRDDTIFYALRSKPPQGWLSVDALCWKPCTTTSKELHKTKDLVRARGWAIQFPSEPLGPQVLSISWNCQHWFSYIRSFGCESCYEESQICWTPWCCLPSFEAPTEPIRLIPNGRAVHIIGLTDLSSSNLVIVSFEMQGFQGAEAYAFLGCFR